MVTRARHSGFTLLELSVVIVIIGLLVGGVIAGQSMIRASEMKSVISDLRGYTAAVAAFKEKYNYLPGDLPTATDYWGTNPTGCSPSWDGVKKATTCNGDGDGNISQWDTNSTFYEQFTAWQHLADAGLVPDRFVGAAFSGVQKISIGNNVPKSRLPNSGWVFYPMKNTWNWAAANVFANDYNTTLLISEPYRSVAGLDVIKPNMSGPEAYNIDMKIDDGKPGFGIVSTWKDDGGLNMDCITTDVQATAEYKIDVDNDLRCSQIYKID